MALSISGNDGFDPAATQLGPAIALLRSFGVPAPRIARLLNVTTGNIRQIDLRAQHPKRDNLEFPKPLSDADLEFAAQHDPLRFELPVPLYGKEKAQVEEIEAKVEAMRQEYAGKYQFQEGILRLKTLQRYVLRASHPRRIRLKARIQQHIAWFHVHNGYSASAITHATIAMQLSLDAYHEGTQDPVDLNRYVESALIASNACLLSRRPKDALALLDLAREAAHATRSTRSSEHFRQRGTALLQIGISADDETRKQYEQAAETMKRNDEARDEHHLKMVGTRQSNLLDPNRGWDNAQEPIAWARESFGRDTLEYRMNLNWGAACALQTGNANDIEIAIVLLSGDGANAKKFGHQATITKLLLITPGLKLTPAQIMIWVRFVLYENAYRNR